MKTFIGGAVFGGLIVLVTGYTIYSWEYWALMAGGIMMVFLGISIQKNRSIDQTTFD